MVKLYPEQQVFQEACSYHLLKQVYTLNTDVQNDGETEG